MIVIAQPKGMGARSKANFSNLPAVIKRAGLPAIIPKAGLPALVTRAGLPALTTKSGLPAVITKAGLPAIIPKAGALVVRGRAGLPAVIPKAGLPAIRAIASLPVPYRNRGAIVGRPSRIRNEASSRPVTPDNWSVARKPLSVKERQDKIIEGRSLSFFQKLFNRKKKDTEYWRKKV